MKKYCSSIVWYGGLIVANSLMLLGFLTVKPILVAIPAVAICTGLAGLCAVFFTGPVSPREAFWTVVDLLKPESSTAGISVSVWLSGLSLVTTAASIVSTFFVLMRDMDTEVTVLTAVLSGLLVLFVQLTIRYYNRWIKPEK